MIRAPLNLEAERDAALQQADESAREAFHRVGVQFPQVTPPRMFAARMGSRPVFLSLADAQAFDEGYLYPDHPWPKDTPAARGASEGWLDRDAHEKRRDEQRAANAHFTRRR